MGSSHSVTANKSRQQINPRKSRFASHQHETREYLPEVSYISNDSVFAPQLTTVFDPEFKFRADITKSEFEIISVLGTGTFGTVYHALWTCHKNIPVALKVQEKRIILSKKAEHQIKRESEIYGLIGEALFFPKYYDCWQTADKIYAVMEYIDGKGDMYALWNENKRFGEQTLRIYATEIGLALDYLRERRIIYRDFKMENIVLDRRRHIKLIDFGFSKRLEEHEKATTICGTLQYMAPEVARGKPYSFEVDWWCFGIVLYILAEGTYPFPNNTATTHFDLIFDTDLYFEKSSHDLKVLIKKLLRIHPHHRLSTFTHLIQEHFLHNKIDVDNILLYEIAFPTDELPNSTTETQLSSSVESQSSQMTTYFDAF